MINPYNYTRQNNGCNFDLKEETSRWSRYSLDFPSALSLSNLGDCPVRGDYYFPRGLTRAPLAILIHGMGNRSVIPCRMIARTLLAKGIACFILYLVFHNYRIPESIKGKYPNMSADEWFECYRLSVTDIRQVIDWAGSKKEIIQDKISVVGISFGGLISTIAMGLDDRIQAGILIVTGGNTDKITRDSLLLRRQYKHDPAEFQRGQDEYRSYLAEVECKGFENVESVKSTYLTDPLTFSSCLRQRPILMLNALWDEMIPRSASIDLWESCGRPPISWYPATHASIWLWYPLMGRRMADFLVSLSGGG